MAIRRVRTPAGDPAWLVTGHAEVRSGYTDRRLGLTHHDPENAPRVEDHQLLGPSLLYSHEDEHTEHMGMRSLLAPFFSGRRIAALQDDVRGLVHDLLDTFTDGAADLHGQLSAPLSARVLCALLGVPSSDHDIFRRLVDAMGDTTERSNADTGQEELTAYLITLVRAKHDEPGDDLVSGLLAAGLEDEDVAGMAAMLLFAGYDSAAVAVDTGVLLFSEHRDQWRLLIEHPELAPSAVEEILRFTEAGGTTFPRYARQDIRLGDAAVARGDAVLFDLGQANVDSDAFPEPQRFDITRTPNPHLSFGHGPWHCVGAPLARLELAEVFSALPLRFPALRSAGNNDDLRTEGTAFTERVRELPVIW
ncbi:cytochrome P450 [Allokutzneria multivorans]|uniref:Cytochrome P450 n=1 Tax=Allokutzneria multivorans TaxID=1142134 RepID=A0ABP7TWW5_9PSEU